MGDYDQAIEWLGQAADERDSLMAFLDGWFAFDPSPSTPSAPTPASTLSSGA